MTEQWYDVLRKARERQGYSRKEMVDMMQVGKASYFRWEHGLAVPIHEYRRGLCAALNLTMEQIGFPTGHKDAPSGTIELEDTSYDRQGMKQFLEGDLNQRLLGIVDAGTYEDQREEFTLITEQFDAMNAEEDESYLMTRRQAVKNLAVFPFAPPINLKNRESVSPSHYELFVKECGASLAACEELAKSSDPDDLEFAFRCVCRYLIELKGICNASLQYRQQALELAAHCAILKTNLGWDCRGNTAVLLFVEDAISLARESGNIRLLLSAYAKQAWAYLFGNERGLALATARDARDLLEKCKGPHPICIRGGIYSTLAVMRARNGLSPDIALKKASEQGPDNEIRYLFEFTGADMWKEQGDALYYTGATLDAMQAYAQIVDPRTLEATKLFRAALTENLRLQVIEGMALASTKGKARNMGNAIRYWEEAIEGAKRLKSKSKFRRALAAHDLMDAAFPDEREVRDLLDHIRSVDKDLLQ